MAKRPRNPNQLAKLTVDIATGHADDTVSRSMKFLATRKGCAGGLEGGRARGIKLTAGERHGIAKKAARARWGKPSKKS